MMFAAPHRRQHGGMPACLDAAIRACFIPVGSDLASVPGATPLDKLRNLSVRQICGYVYLLLRLPQW